MSEVATGPSATPTSGAQPINAAAPPTAEEGRARRGAPASAPVTGAAPQAAALATVPAPRAAATVVAPARRAAVPGAPAVTAAPAPAASRPVATRVQSGRIIDEAGQPLVGATVLLKGTAQGASTDASGSYSLIVPLGVNTFLIGYSGYQDEVAQSRDGQPLTVTLLPAAPPEDLPPPAPARKKRR